MEALPVIVPTVNGCLIRAMGRRLVRPYCAISMRGLSTRNGFAICAMRKTKWMGMYPTVHLGNLVVEAVSLGVQP